MTNQDKNGDEKQTKRGDQPFGLLMKSMNDFFQEKPVKGLLQTMDEFFRNPLTASTFDSELHETESEHIIRAPFPGINREQINIDIMGNNLTISVKEENNVKEENSKNGNLQFRQWRNQKTRTFTLPYVINEKSTSATYKNGLLEIHIEKQKGKNILIKE